MGDVGPLSALSAPVFPSVSVGIQTEAIATCPNPPSMVMSSSAFVPKDRSSFDSDQS